MTYQNNPLFQPNSPPVAAPTPADIAVAEARQAALDAQSAATDAAESKDAADLVASQVAAQIDAAEDIVDEVEAAATDFTPIVFAGTSLTINAANAATYNGRYLSCTASSAVTITYGNDITGSFFSLIGQDGSGRVTLSAGSGATMRNAQLLFKTRGTGVIVSVVLTGNATGTNAVYSLNGDVAV
ncbi:hypothetical protein [Rhizobium sp. Nf11,1]|uniref:hypothetical protein n=1 Tax=Rhizobium sp. Nf11,1 TaxID=3404923 RepID=UPI003D3305F8